MKFNANGKPARRYPVDVESIDAPPVNDDAVGGLERFAVRDSISSAAADSAPNPFAPERLRLSKGTAAAVKKVVTVVPCRKPGGTQDFVRVRPGEDWRLEAGVLEDKLH